MTDIHFPCFIEYVMENLIRRFNNKGLYYPPTLFLLTAM